MQARPRVWESHGMPLAAAHKLRHTLSMPDVPATSQTAALAQELLDLTARLGARADEDPFGNPVLLVSLAITRHLDTGYVSEADISGLIRHLRDAAYADRAARIPAYLGGIDTDTNDGILAGL